MKPKTTAPHFPLAEVINLAERRHLYERPFKTKQRGRAVVVSIIDYVEEYPCPFQVGDLIKGKTWKTTTKPRAVTSTESTGLSIYTVWLIGFDDSPACFTAEQFVLVKRAHARRESA